ncbi:hypothetical protein [Pseudomonas iridis]|uniref:hypothetical protein n=1 Tax=Pseudomonas iridis TaxID=2710587 RepID=UPI001B33BA45|nr:hypothetical protein [Pseudomonas iridis]MBP5966787.1 hypothetical protein [Pseudomonas iridis]
MSRLPHISSTEQGPVSVIAGPWPSYSRFKGLPERDRWVLYGSAKAYRQALEDQGLVMAEGYDAFIRRVTGELEL